MMAAILFLDRVAFDARLSKNRAGDTASNRAQALLSTFLKWPRHGESDLAFDFRRTGCQIILRGSTVDHATLKQSEIVRSGNPNNKLLRLSSLIDSDSDIVDLLDARRRKLRNLSRLSEVSVNKLTAFIVEFAEAFADLWESTKGDPAWGEVAVSDIGVLTNSWGKCRPIPTSYISSVVTEVKDTLGTPSRLSGGPSGARRVSVGCHPTDQPTVCRVFRWVPIACPSGATRPTS